MVRRRMKITQPVLIQSFVDEFDMDSNIKPSTPAEPGQILVKCEEKHELGTKQKKIYRSGVGKLLYLMRWSRPDISNATRELSKFMMTPGPAHLQAMVRAISYVVATESKGLILQPTGTWNATLNRNKVDITGISDANYATDPDNRKSVS